MSAAVDTALQTKLAAIGSIATSAPGGIHNSVRPQGSSFPVIVYQQVGSQDLQSFSDSGVEWIDYQVKVIAPKAQAGSIAAIVASIHTALERAPLTISGYTHLATLRQRRLPTYPEQAASGEFIHQGAMYRIWVAA